MAMEERQTKIREGAGLEEGRLNTEFIEMMKKWGPHLVTGLAVLVLGYFGYHKWEEYTAKKNDSAFVELSAAATSASPTNLESVARDYTGTTVAIEANLYAADLHMSAARTGVPIGAKFNAPTPAQPQVDTNKLADDKAFLTSDEQKKELAEADRLYQSVVSQANASEGQSLLAIGALSGLASIAEDRAELDKAKSFYQQAMAKASAHKMDKLEALLKKRHDSVDSLKDAPKLYAMADLPGAAASTITAPMGGMTAKTADGQTITIGPGGQITPGPATPAGTTPITLPNGGSLNLTPVAPPSGAPAVNPTPTPAPAPAPTPEPAKPATP